MPPLLEKTTAIESESAIPGSFPSHSSGSSQESLISSPILLSSDSSPYKQPLKRRRRVSNESLSLETDSNPLYSSSSWQSLIPSSTPLSNLYIPGTHESLALRFSLFGTKCQSLSITQQLLIGIRFFDFRLRLDEDSGELLAYHGFLPMGSDLGSVLGRVYEFLESEEGERETIVISFKQENTSNPLFATTLLELLRERKNVWYFENRWPNLGQVRGKCVLFCRFDFDAGLGLHPIDWPFDSNQVWETDIGGKRVQVQDWHGISSFLSLPLKSSLILSLFPPTTTSSKFRINYLSCSSPNPFSFGFPQFCAKGFLASRWWVERGWGFKGINELVLEGLVAREGEKRGEKHGQEEEKGEEEGMVVMMDYCEFPRGGELVKKIIGMNFRGSLRS